MRAVYLIAGLGLLLAGCAPNDSTSAPAELTSGSLSATIPKTAVKDSPEALLARIDSALESGDKAATLALWDWDGVTNREQLETAFLEHVGSCERVTGIIPPGDRPADYVRNGIRYRTNREIEARVELQCGTDGMTRATSVPFGSKNGGYALVNVVEDAILDYDGPDDVSLSASVMGVSTPGGNHFEGTCDYIVSGETRQLKIEGDGNKTMMVWGSRFQRCEIRRLEGSGWVQLKLSVAGEDVYESEKTELDEPLTYSGDA